MTISGLGMPMPFLQIFAGQQCFQVTDRAITDVYIGTDPSVFLARGEKNQVAIQFSHPTTIGVALKRRQDEWDAHPVHSQAIGMVTFVNGIGKKYVVTGSHEINDLRAAVVWDVGHLAEGLNRFLFGQEEVQVLLPPSATRPLITGETASFVSAYEKAHKVPFPSGKERLVLGRDPKPGVHALHEPQVSTMHATIIRDHGFWIEDLGSTNGTFVDQTRLSRGERRRLRAGQIFYLADVPVTIRET